MKLVTIDTGKAGAVQVTNKSFGQFKKFLFKYIIIVFIIFIYFIASYILQKFLGPGRIKFGDPPGSNINVEPRLATRSSVLNLKGCWSTSCGLLALKF